MKETNRNNLIQINWLFCLCLLHVYILVVGFLNKILNYPKIRRKKKKHIKYVFELVLDFLVSILFIYV
jgi:hypothetical protein